MGQWGEQAGEVQEVAASGVSDRHAGVGPSVQGNGEIVRWFAAIDVSLAIQPARQGMGVWSRH